MDDYDNDKEFSAIYESIDSDDEEEDNGDEYITVSYKQHHSKPNPYLRPEKPNAPPGVGSYNPPPPSQPPPGMVKLLANPNTYAPSAAAGRKDLNAPMPIPRKNPPPPPPPHQTSSPTVAKPQKYAAAKEGIKKKPQRPPKPMSLMCKKPLPPPQPPPHSVKPPPPPRPPIAPPENWRENLLPEAEEPQDYEEYEKEEDQEEEVTYDSVKETRRILGRKKRFKLTGKRWTLLSKSAPSRDVSQRGMEMKGTAGGSSGGGEYQMEDSDEVNAALRRSGLKVVCILLAITMTSLVIAVASLTLGLYSTSMVATLDSNSFSTCTTRLIKKNTAQDDSNMNDNNTIYLPHDVVRLC